MSARFPAILCNICSFSPSYRDRIVHYHYDSISVAKQSGSSLYYCLQCKQEHDVDMVQGGRRRVVVTDSLINHFWEEPTYKGDPIHIDYTCIPGATVQRVQLAWQQTYREDPVSQDIVAICGINNLLKRGESGDRVMDRLHEFGEVVSYHNRNHTFAVATLPCVPALAWLPGNNRVLGWDA